MENNSIENIKVSFKASDDIRDAGLTSPESILRYDNIQYGNDGLANVLDVYHLKNINKPQATIVSVHGGGWIYGDKERYQYYCMDLALRGFTVVNFTYRLAPENPFPAAFEDVNAVFNWISANCQKYNIDCNKLFIVGDSAGGQLASQYCALFTNEEYQQLFDFTVPTESVKILGAAFHSGVYDVRAYLASGENEIITAYINEGDEKQLAQIDTLSNITNNYPPSLIMTSYYDFLREQAKPFYEHLKSKGIDCKFKLYGEEGETHMEHVFHLNLKLKEAKECNDAQCEFFRSLLH